jgi:hypothetical protein
LTPEQLSIIALPGNVIDEARRQIMGCERCRPADAQIPLDWLIRHVRGAADSPEYIWKARSFVPVAVQLLPRKRWWIMRSVAVPSQSKFRTDLLPQTSVEAVSPKEEKGNILLAQDSIGLQRPIARILISRP